MLQFLEDTARSLEPLLESRNLVLDWSASDENLPPVRADVARLRQVLENLVDNAADASGRGSVVSLRVRAVAKRQVAIDVIDRGRVIAPGDLARIFEPFFTTRSDGTGLGLAIAKKLVSAHGGEIDVRSEPGGGSTFSVLLPA